VQWSEADSLFVLATDGGYVYTSADGITWTGVVGNSIASVILYLAILGGTWVVIAENGSGVRQILVQLDAGRSDWIVVPFFANLAPSLSGLVTLDNRFGMAFNGSGGSMNLRKSLRV
jgi:hypothetical protein